MTTASELDLSSLDKDPRLFLYTSLTAGSSHIITATSRMETILKANRIPFLAVDLATDEKCRRLWQRRGGAKKKLPGLVKEGYIIGDLEEVEEWNEFGELQENIGPVPPSNTAPPGAHVGVSTAPPLSANVKAAQGPQANVPQSGFDKTKAVALPGAEEMAAILKAKKAEQAAKATPVPAPVVSEAPTPKLSDATNSEKVTSGEKSAEKASKETTSSTEKDDLLKEVEAVDVDSPKQETKAETEPPTEGVAGLQVKEEAAEDAEDASEVKASEVTSTKDNVEAKSDVQDDEQTKTQEQSAKDPAAAGQSVED